MTDPRKRAAFRDRNLSVGPTAKPWPGTEAARAAGCTCPVIDNGYGRGYQWRPEQAEPNFCILEGCPVHWPAP